MALNNAQYDEIMRGYDLMRTRNRHVLESRTAEVYLAVPQYKQCQDEAADISMQAMRASLRGDSSLISSLNERVEALQRQMDAALTDAGFPVDYLQMPCDCPICKDTGYVDNKKCACFKQAEINLLYHQSNLSEILRRENFDFFSLDYYSNTGKIQKSDITPRENMEMIVAGCREFIANFPNGQNILFMGSTGVGKTFLSNCIAKELLDSSHSVLYVSAIDLFQFLSYKNDDEEAPSLKNFLDCELLIIDDLGTEFTNAYTNSLLFNLLNNRMLSEQSTIISTNLSLSELMSRYSERLFSRVYSSYTSYKLVGDDIRLIKKK